MRLRWPLVAQLGYESTADEVAQRLARVLARSDQQFIVAEDSGRLVGWVHVELTEYVESGVFAVIGGLVVTARIGGGGPAPHCWRP